MFFQGNATTHSLAQVVCVLQDLVEFDQVSDDHFSMRVQYRECNKDDKLVGVVIREEDLFNRDGVRYIVGEGLEVPLTSKSRMTSSNLNSRLKAILEKTSMSAFWRG